MMVIKMAANSARWGGDREDDKIRWRRTVRGGLEIEKAKKKMAANSARWGVYREESSIPSSSSSASSSSSTNQWSVNVAT